jgi:4-hydroxy-2-oxoheptanedioate aldolase
MPKRGIDLKNYLKNTLEKNKYVIGPFMKLPSPAVVEIMGKGGFDYIIIDCEHGPLEMMSAENMIRAAHLVGMAAIIRVSENCDYLISRALDIGADGVQIPQISTVEDAKKAVKAAKFSPAGQRGVCRYVRAAEYSALNKEQYFSEANENAMVIIQIEGLEGIKNIDKIMEVEGIDVIFIGPYDLSQSLGIPGQVNHEAVREKMKEVISKAEKKGK